MLSLPYLYRKFNNIRNYINNVKKKKYAQFNTEHIQRWDLSTFFKLTFFFILQ